MLGASWCHSLSESSWPRAQLPGTHKLEVRTTSQPTKSSRAGDSGGLAQGISQAFFYRRYEVVIGSVITNSYEDSMTQIDSA